MFFAIFYFIAAWLGLVYTDELPSFPPLSADLPSATQVVPHRAPIALYKSSEEHRMENLGLVNVRQYVPDIRVDLSYASHQNILGVKMYDYNEAYLQPAAALKLSNAQNLLKAVNHNLTLVIHDATRPRFVQQKCWEFSMLKGVQYLFTPPTQISMHSYGVAVDVTIFDLNTYREVDMGSLPDAPGKLAAPKNEEELLLRGVLTPKQVENRILLRNIMRSAGFRPISNEWWHFEAFSRYEVQDMFLPVP